MTRLSRRGRRLAGGTVALGVVAVLIVAVVIVVHLAHGLVGSSGDYTGDGSGTVLVVVHPGDSSTAIADTLVADKVVRSAGAFTSAADAEPAFAAARPGHLPAAPAHAGVTRALVDAETDAAWSTTR